MWSTTRKNQQFSMFCGCGFSFKNELVQNIRNHVKSCNIPRAKPQIHNVKTGFRCGFCGFLFAQNTEKEFKKHMNIHHPQGQTEKCFCESCYPPSSLAPKDFHYFCSACDYQTDCKTQAKRHDLITHDTKCPYCQCRIESSKLPQHIDKKHFMLQYFLSRMQMNTSASFDESLAEDFPTESTKLDLTQLSISDF